MSSASETLKNAQLRRYERATSVIFLKTNEAFGGLSNMAGGFALKVNGLRIFTTEALYQACRFPHRPEVQRLIIGHASPMTAKMKGKPYRHDTRPDWDRVRVKIMRWCLRVKLAQNWDAFSELLLKTGDRPIVEKSRKDDFWGAKETEEGVLVGRNVLGRLLMELREAVKTENKDTLLHVEPLAIPDFLLDGRPVEVVQPIGAENRELSPRLTDDGAPSTATGVGMRQTSLFDPPTVKEVSTPECASKSTKSMDIADLKPYPAYKDSDVPWLGEMPVHWEVRRLKSSARFIMGQSPSSDDCSKDPIGPPFLQGCAEFGLRFPKPKQFCRSAATMSPNSAILMSVRAPVGKLNVADQVYGIGRGLCAVVPNSGSLDASFTRYAFEASADGLVLVSTGSTYDAVSVGDIGSQPLLLPPLLEQAAIVRFLDYADRRIRCYIRARQKLIKLLEEQKQAIIHRAVTRGLNPNVRLKPSGVEWLGDIPEHWEVRRNGLLFAQRNESGFAALPVLEVSLKTGIRIRDFDNSDRKQAMSDRDKYKRAVKGDIAYNMMRMWQGAVGVAPIEGLVSPAYVVAKPLHGTEPRYFSYLFRTAAYMREIDKCSRGIVKDRNRLYWEDFKQMVSAYPPSDEQVLIADAIDQRGRTVNYAIDRAQREIVLLREYRTRLIADVVTGKLDVREAAARLPDEAEEPEPLEEVDARTDAEEDATEDLDAVPEEAEA